MKRSSSAVWLVALVGIGGCGGSGHGQAVKQLTVPAYGGFPSTTIAVAAGTPAYCRRDAEAFARDAVSFRKPFPSDADQYRVMARLQFVDFNAHLCDVTALRKALLRGLTAKQVRALIPQLSFLGATGRELTK
jgi:hypothetical protein